MTNSDFVYAHGLYVCVCWLPIVNLVAPLLFSQNPCVFWVSICQREKREKLVRNWEGVNEVVGVISSKIVALWQDCIRFPQAPTCRACLTRQLCSHSESFYFTIMMTRGGTFSDFPTSISRFYPPPMLCLTPLAASSSSSLPLLLPSPYSSNPSFLIKNLILIIVTVALFSWQNLDWYCLCRHMLGHPRPPQFHE